MTNWSVSENYCNDLLEIASTILFHLIEGSKQITYLPLMKSMMEIHFLLAVHFIFLVVFLPPQQSALFPTWLSTVLQLYLLDISIFTKKKKLNRGGVYNRLTRDYCPGKFNNLNRCLQISLWFCKVCNRFNKKVYYCRQVRCNCFETHYDYLVRPPWHVSCLTRP